jgi:hypothetical protein
MGQLAKTKEVSSMGYLNSYQNKPLYISDLQKTINTLPHHMRQQIVLYLTVNQKKEYRKLEFYMPVQSILCQDRELYENYFLAMVNNLLVTFGGVTLDFYYDKKDSVLSQMVKRIIEKFDLDSPNNYRKGYGVYINYINRMNVFLGNGRFNMHSYDISEFRMLDRFREYRICSSNQNENQINLLKSAASKLDRKCICSLDVGGNSIKGAVVRDGEIEILKEFQWYPTAFKVADEIIKPILAMLRFLNACMYYKDRGGSMDSVKAVFEPNACLNSICEATEMMEKGMPAGTRYFDAAVIGFPDIVVNNKVAGGESYKQMGMRNNPDTEYEDEFLKTSALNEYAEEYVKKDGVVCVLNDGNAASFIISVEQAFSGESIIGDNGILAHTIGTEMGTGFISKIGTIQNIPLEGFQHIIDLGSVQSRQYPAEDVRSINSLNTGIPGTVQKYISQLGLFRMAVSKILDNDRPLFDSLIERGLLEYSKDGKVLTVPMHPIDKRSEMTREMIKLLRKNNGQVTDAFKTMGKALGVLIDQGRIILPELETTRLLSGGLVACDDSYELIREGLKEHNRDYDVLRLDENIVESPLLKKMQAHQRNFNVAIGSAYIANRILIEREEGIDNK